MESSSSSAPDTGLLKEGNPIVTNEYDELIKGLPSEPMPGPFSSVTKRLDFLAPEIMETFEGVGKLEYALAQLAAGGLPAAAEAVLMKREQVPFAYNIPALVGVTLTEYCPFSGYIKEVTIHWPQGCDGLCEVRVGHGTKQFCPDDGFLALNDATPTFDFNEPVKEREDIWVELKNGDGVNSHNITCTLILEGVSS
jgi:hypothetical protein